MGQAGRESRGMGGGVMCVQSGVAAMCTKESDPDILESGAYMISDRKGIPEMVFLDLSPFAMPEKDPDCCLPVTC